VKVVRQSETELVLEDSSLWLAAVMAAAAAFLAYGAYFTGKKPTFVAAALFLLFAWFTLHKTTIVFDSLQRRMMWQRLHYFKKSSGSIPFDEIKDIIIETSAGDSGGRATFRLAIVTSQGSWPTSDSYGGNGETYNSLRAQIREFLKLNPSQNAESAKDSTSGEAGLDSSIRSLLAQGRKVDAIKLVRSSKGTSLIDAKEQVDEIEKKMTGQALK
jgi:hypothetical protein